MQARVECVADLAGESVGETLVVAAENDVRLWLSVKPPAGVSVADQLRLAVTRRKEDHQPLALAAGDAFKLIVDDLLIRPVPGKLWSDLFQPCGERSEDTHV